MLGLDGPNTEAARAAREKTGEGLGELHPIELVVSHQDLVDACIADVIARLARIDVLIHNAGHMVLGPAEAFTPEQLADSYDTNVVSSQRLNRAALLHMLNDAPPPPRM